MTAAYDGASANADRIGTRNALLGKHGGAPSAPPRKASVMDQC